MGKTKKTRKTRKTRKTKKQANRRATTICMLGLIPLIFIALEYKSHIALLVLINGLIYHSKCTDHILCKSIYQKNSIARYTDIICNLILVSYINLKTLWQPYTLIISTLTPTIWLFKTNFFHGHTGQIIHVLFVQWPCFFALFKYYKLRREKTILK